MVPAKNNLHCRIHININDKKTIDVFVNPSIHPALLEKLIKKKYSAKEMTAAIALTELMSSTR